MLPVKINAGIKKKFLEFGLKVEKVSKFSKETYESPGHKWDALLSYWISWYCPIVFRESSEDEEAPASRLITFVEEEHTLSFLVSKFPLFGFMRTRTVAGDQKKHPKLYLWQGEADAIAYSYLLQKYVIVDFKVVDYLSDYCTSKTDLCGKHLHQCLVYAKLLQLQMGLDYLPPSLIVAIDRFTGKDGYFPLFKDYPEECKQMLDEYEWFKEQPPKRHPLKIYNPEKLLSPFVVIGFTEVSPKTTLQALFNGDATVEDLLDLLGCDSIEIVPSGSSNTND